MLGLCGSLSLPSLLLSLDPVTRRRLCVRGACTAATRESIQICVCAVCVLLVPSVPSNFTVAISACFPSSFVIDREIERKHSKKRGWNSEHRHPSTVSGTIIPAAVTPHNNNSRTQKHGMRRKNSAPGTHSDGHYHQQQQEPWRVFRYPRVSTHRATPADEKTTSKMQENTAVLC
ncbi:hypothetical protein TCDM_10442 [Trypanosoma cruzi Dm28c]|uniref:Uncharacterized protein n=1 Tax=Trypanosoma cruzi Dm28c TaxID=1416333 RepID=V5B2W3_TRYCR|nr:hypothetical protein TCDM_10442 [Trypanosoma cruzi Dm28c]